MRAELGWSQAHRGHGAQALSLGTRHHAHLARGAHELGDLDDSEAVCDEHLLESCMYRVDNNLE